jgi:sigma-B regulation protein RsbU (phosphoserine phosphatase)
MPPIPYSELQQALARGLPYVAIASVCLAAGLSALALSLLRSRERLLLWFGLFSAAYGLRLFWETNLVRAAFGAPELEWPVAVATYLLPLPFSLFFLELMGGGWKSSLRIWPWILAIFAPAAILLGPIAGFKAAADRANNILIIGSAVLIFAHLLAPQRRAVLTALRLSLFFFFALVLLNNLHIHPAGYDPEPFGFVVLIAGLGYAAARHAFEQEQKLAAVETELATARRIQASILPRSLPVLQGLSLAASYQPMTQVAGDFYDFLPLDSNRITLLIADVSGHGVPAALIASMLKVAFAQQTARATDPAAVLTAMNGILNGVLDGQFVTAACVHLDLAARNLAYSAAGHPPALLRRQASGEIIELAENGLFLGPFRHAAYSNLQAPFEPGDRLLLYTDGIIEATFTDGEPFGAVRLRDFFSSRAAAAPAALAGALMQTVSAREQEDDLTVVVAEA